MAADTVAAMAAATMDMTVADSAAVVDLAEVDSVEVVDLEEADSEAPAADMKKSMRLVSSVINALL